MSFYNHDFSNNLRDMTDKDEDRTLSLMALMIYGFLAFTLIAVFALEPHVGTIKSIINIFI